MSNHTISSRRAFRLLTPAVALGLVLAGLVSTARAGDVEAADDEGTSLDELLGSDVLVDDETRSPEEQLHWLLVDRLATDFARTESLTTRLESAPLVEMRSPGWLGAFEARAYLARLRGATHHTLEEVATGVTFDIPLAEHPLVDAYIDYFSGRGKAFFTKWLARAERYAPIMQPILAKHGLPKDIIYLAMIESGLSSTALSRTKAGGFWQFMPATARLFHLDMNTWVDARQDFIRATEAAATYLKDLHDDFGDWHLAWAAYNGGRGRVHRALTRTGTKTFWQLLERKNALPEETRHYVPKIIAAAIVAKSAKQYGFDAIEPLSQLAYDELTVDAPLDLRLLGRALGVDLATLRTLNPSLLQDVTPPGRAFVVRVPRGDKDKATEWIASLAPSERLRYQAHRLARGETLWGIARRYGTSVRAICDFNQIRHPNRLRPGVTLVVPMTSGNAQGKKSHAVASRRRGRRPASERTTARATASEHATASAANSPRERHTVAAGETLWAIAQRYGVSVDSLKEWNGRESNKIGVGEVLKIF